MAPRCFSTGQQFVHAGCDTSADLLFERHLPKLALFCLRFTQDEELAAALAERVLQKARRKIASSAGSPDFSRSLYSVLREECRAPVRRESAAAVPRLRTMEEVP
jgi:DNA-directed RNA polymerase specialized sigma24 family protein